MSRPLLAGGARGATAIPSWILRLLRDRNLSIATLSMFLLGFMLYSSTMLLPIFMQTLPGAAVNIVFLPVVGKLVSKVQARWLVICGMAVSATGLFLMAGFNSQVDFRTVAYARIVQSIGLSFLFVPLNTIAFSRLAKENINRAAGLINLARNVGGSCGIAIVTTILARRVQFHQNVLVAHLTPYDHTYREMLRRTTGMLLSKGAAPVEATRQAHGLIYRLVHANRRRWRSSTTSGCSRFSFYV